MATVCANRLVLYLQFAVAEDDSSAADALWFDVDANHDGKASGVMISCTAIANSQGHTVVTQVRSC